MACRALRIALLLLVAFILMPAMNATGQSVPTESPEVRARSAMDRGEYWQAIPILSDALRQRPSADTYLNLGIAYRLSLEWQKAEDTLSEGADRYPQDPRIPTELANTYLGAGNVEGARDSLHRALRIDPSNMAAAEMIADIELSEGEVQTALRFWNRSGHPIVGIVQHNSYATFGNWTVRDAHAFHPGEVLTFAQWRTTQLRLLETNIFSNVGFNVEPAPAASRYNPVILTSERSNDLANLGFGVIKGAPFQTSYLDWWNIGNSGITLNSSYRWDYNRKRGELHLHAPIPVPGILFMHAEGLWRSERWDLSNVLQSDAGKNDRFDYKSTGVRVDFTYIPHYRFDFGGGFEYTNRAARGGLTPLIMDSRNSGKILAQGSIRLADSRFQNRLHAEGLFARQKILGDLNYSAARFEMNNRYLISKRTHTSFAWTIKGGISKGQLPVEEYFVLGLDGLDTHADLLRAHPASDGGHYGNSPMGTSFALSNMDLERRLTILPLFNTLNIPYLEVKAKVFLDIGKTHDREQIFKQDILYVDTGTGLKLATPTYSLNLIYGRSLHDGRNVFSAYLEKHW